MKALGALSVFLVVAVLAFRLGLLPPLSPAVSPPVVAQQAPTPVAPSRVRVVDRQAVVRAIRSNAFLVTTSYQAAVTVSLERQGHFFGLIDGEQIVVAAFGVVRSGVDLSQLEQSDVIVRGTTVVITLPAPQIESATLDEEDTFVADHSLSFFADADPALADQARRLAVQEVHRIACVNGLEQRTEQDTREAVAGLVETFGFTSVEVVVPSSTFCTQ